MSTGTDRQVQAYLDSISAFNAGDASAFLALLDDDCDWPGVGSSRAEIVLAVEAARALGWVRHDVISLTSNGCLMSGIARNTMADGTTFLVAGAFKFSDGKISGIHSIDDL